MFAGREDTVVSRRSMVGSFAQGVREHGKPFLLVCFC